MFNLTFHKEGYENSYSGDTEECPKPRIKLIRGDTVEYIPTTTELAGKPEICIVDGVRFHYLEQMFPFILGEGRWNAKAVSEAIDKLKPCGDDSFTISNFGNVGSTYYTHGPSGATSTEDNHIYGAVCSNTVWYRIDTETKTLKPVSGYVSGTDAHDFTSITKQGFVTLNQFNRNIQGAVYGEVKVNVPQSNDVGRPMLKTELDMLDYAGSYEYDLVNNIINQKKYILADYRVIVNYPNILCVNKNNEVFEYKKSGFVRKLELDGILLFDSSYFMLGNNKFLKVKGNDLFIINLKTKIEIKVFTLLLNSGALNILYAPNGYVYFQSCYAASSILLSIDKNTNVVKEYNRGNGHDIMNMNLGLSKSACGFGRGSSSCYEISFTNTDQFNPLLMSNILYKNC